MSIKRLSGAGLTTPKSNKLWDQTTFQSGMFALATISLTSGQTSVTFSDISNNYTHLQLRVFAKTNTAPNFYDTVVLRFNEDSGSNYSYHYIEGYNTTPSSGAVINASSMQFYSIGGNANASMFGSMILDITDYANTNKFKTVKELGGFDGNTSGGSVYLGSGNWRSTSAITSITLSNSHTFSPYSHFALYGIKVA